MPASFVRLTRLRLQDFRNYAALTWSPGGVVAVVTGPNGSGKTNLLEAVSLLVPGRGLRGARGGDLPRRGGGVGGWGINAVLEGAEGELEIGTGGDPGVGDRRVFRVDGAPVGSVASVGERLAVVWLTPQMDALFLEPASGRRRFLDRLVQALEPGHGRQVASHDHAQTQRGRLLASGRADAAWLAALEDQVARHAVAATALREGLVNRLNAALAEGVGDGFPAVRMDLICPIAERLRGGSALAAEDWLREAQAGARERDRDAGAASFGAQKADMGLAELETGLSAELASTGQRKAMLVGVVLGHAALIGRVRGAAPMLLLDEPMVHLDAARRAALAGAVAGVGAQCLLTGTDREGFAALEGRARFYVTGGGALQG